MLPGTAMKRPHLQKLAEGSGDYARLCLFRRPKRTTMPLADWYALAYACAVWAGHWGRLTLGDEGLR
jgi:hypothetical protein